VKKILIKNSAQNIKTKKKVTGIIHDDDDVENFVRVQ